MLAQILAEKEGEVAALRKRYAGWEAPAVPPVRRDFTGALRGPGIALIAEFKRRSPSRGLLAVNADPAQVARAYQKGGAAALSVLTDGTSFGGSLDDLAAARGAVTLPVLRKDFIIDRCQVAQSSCLEGPDALLLITAALEGGRLQSLRQLAADCGQSALTEVHDEAELDRALASGAEIIGINNRDLHTFEISLEVTLRLRPRVPAGLPVVAESGIHSRDDVLRLTDAGVDAILVGEALMTSGDPAGKIRELLGRA